MTDPFIPESTKLETSEAVERLIRRIDQAIELAEKSGSTEGVWLFAKQWRTIRAALATPAVSVPVGEDGDDPCEVGQHCCCCGPNEPCCDCGEIMPSASCAGERCWCGAPASKKVGEEIAFDDPAPQRHNLTSYVCARHYAQIMGPLGAKQVGIDPDAASPNPPASPSVAIGAGEVMRQAILGIEMVPVTPPYSNFDCGWDAAVKAYRKAIAALAPASASIPADVEREAWLPISDDAKTGAMVELIVDYSNGDHPLADGVRACTIGFNTLADTGEDEWKFAGWCWSHDHFVQGRGTPIAWRPSRLNATDDELPALAARPSTVERG